MVTHPKFCKLKILKKNPYLFIYLLIYFYSFFILERIKAVLLMTLFSSFLYKVATSLVASLTAMICVGFSVERRFF